MNQTKKRIEDDDEPKLKDWVKFLLVAGIPLWIILFFWISGSIDIKREERERANRPKVTWKELMTPEEIHEKGLDRLNDEPSTYKAPADIHERIQSVLKEGSREDRLINELSDVDYHDVLDYLGGPEGF